MRARTIEKSADPVSWELFNGDDATSNWTVSVTKGEPVDLNWAAGGVITITNNHPNKAAQLVSVADLVSPDVAATVDFNVVMTGDGGLVEVQGTAEGAPYTREQLDRMLDLAGAGIEQLVELQAEAVSG